MRIENSFHVPAGLEESWQIVSDVASLVSCMPGAELTETTADGAYRGIARVKIGPVALQFNGEARLHEVDAVAHTMKVRSRASDAKGRGTVASEMALALVAEGERTRVDVVTDLTLTGAVAQYGRGAGLIREVASQFTRDFAANLESRVLTKSKTVARPVSGLRLLVSALRAMIGRWFRA
ncbi:MAG TPA: SRPBCC family protein [Burkholderiales bacterium]|nr:SRPBCC family protein [Burkholderiales bacterium]